MKTQSALLIRVALLATATIFSSTVLSARDSDDTASYYKAHAYDYENKKVEIEVAFVHGIAKGREAENGLRLVRAHTYNEDGNSSGGNILCVVSEADYDRLIDRYGTSIERKGREPDTRSLRGTLRILDKKRDLIYLDLTDKGAELNETMKSLIARESNGKGGGGNGMKEQREQQRQERIQERKQQKH